MQATHHESEDLRQPVTAYQRTAFLLFDGVEAPEGEEDVHLIPYCCRTRT